MIGVSGKLGHIVVVYLVVLLVCSKIYLHFNPCATICHLGHFFRFVKDSLLSLKS